jgi:hypothetical protein
MKKLNISKQLVPIEKCSILLTTSMKFRCQVIRNQFPLVIAEALTIHKSQGQTYKEVCIDLRCSNRITRQQLYVAFSRVTSLSGLYISVKFKPPTEREENPISKEMERLCKEQPLQLLIPSFKKSRGLKIMYLNINGLLSKIEDINCDETYQHADILIFSETLCKKHDIIEIPNFTLF